ncbi:VacJ family lipoprotein [Acinetobacter qingfengensis]|uniref:Uncharacterized protein n=1 Tax=Acinetobacter qingfengensis TaxID=1262585 RepID=A0A1E7RF07_9GAMM|nr:VacJ family lipoprotein [Acinetobacter qingfengensis]KAA8731923.1 VacJ family lipoprotein [Acinetobacter qingfengensis]OEY97954.1 hypothetical protein BJI46_00005 [Acinetobacter qingfengensis]
MYKFPLQVIFFGAIGLANFAMADDGIQSSVNADATVPDDNSLNNDVDDIYSLNALKKIHFNQLKIDAKANQPEHIKDPLQPINRKIYVFNNYLDTYIARPIALQYVKVIPEDIRGTYGNFRTNMREPWNAVNQTLQGKPKTSLKSLGRFTLNILTSLGFADVARRKHLENEATDFGITLGVWGLPSGPYLMLPILGPSTFRDGVGTAVDSFGRTQSYIIDDDKLYWSVRGIDLVDSRSKLLDVDSLLQGDQYAVIRDAYLQQRAYAVTDARGEDVSADLFSGEDNSSDFIDEQDQPNEVQ